MDALVSFRASSCTDPSLKMAVGVFFYLRDFQENKTIPAHSQSISAVCCGWLRRRSHVVVFFFSPVCSLKIFFLLYQYISVISCPKKHMLKRDGTNLFAHS